MTNGVGDFRIELSEASSHPRCVIHNELLTFLGLFKGFDFGDAAGVTPTFKRGIEKNLYQAIGRGFVRVLCAERQDVGVIVSARKANLVCIDTKSRTNTVDFVGGDRHPDATGANENALVRMA